MVFKEYTYGQFKKEIKELVRKRLALKDKVRYHHKKIEEMENKIIEVEKELDNYLERAK